MTSGNSRDNVGVAPRPDHPATQWPYVHVALGYCTAPRMGQRRAAATSGRAAVQIVERVVMAPARPVSPPTPRQGDWVGVLGELAKQLDRGLVWTES